MKLYKSLLSTHRTTVECTLEEVTFLFAAMVSRSAPGNNYFSFFFLWISSQRGPMNGARNIVTHV